jgi:hypothetical protein
MPITGLMLQISGFDLRKFKKIFVSAEVAASSRVAGNLRSFSIVQKTHLAHIAETCPNI